MNAKQLGAKLEARAAEVQKQAMVGLLRGAHEVVATSVKLTPKETGNLRDQQSADTVSQDTVRIDVDADYAAAVHEDMEAHHEVGQAKYLATAINEEKGTVIDLVKREAQV